ncbi:MAG: NusA-like transcription termination signal-binding factor [Candidatus Aenigmarchaeota archaeon]|nr:NusA-like transcription termination signal-binding factor [Candidatus Aenigmarchaeota archaeon]MCK5289716.1 NusA-like transcription termination signal-binding factor [Candidatus Aenigmarchaeota archaeon]
MKPLDTQTIRDIVQFEKLSGCQVFDSILDDDTLYLVVKSQNIYNLIGRDGENIKRISGQVGKSLKVYQHSKDPLKFAANMFSRRARKVDIEEIDGVKVLKVWVLPKDKRLVLGRKGNNIKIMGEFLKRHFQIKGIDVIDSM